MTTRRTVVLSLLARCGASLLALGLVAITWTVSGEQVKQPSERDARRIQPSAQPDPAARQRFLAMFARAYFPGRTGQLLIVPREGDFITRSDPNVEYMHGSPWSYDVSIPLMFAGPAVKPGVYSVPAAQQDVAPTLAASLGIQMPPTATGRLLPVLRQGFARPRVVMLLVLDGMRRDYFDRYAASMPMLTALRQQSAWFTQARVNVLPSNTAVGHSTISTGADPRVHGITGVSVYDRTHGRRHDVFAGGLPDDLMALTLADVWQLADGWSRDRTGTGQHRPSGDAARRAWSVSVEWRASRACKLRSTDGQLDHEPQLLPAACVPKGSKCKRPVAGRRGMDESQNRLGCRGALFGSVSGIRS